jgi:hypothetical protein
MAPSCELNIARRHMTDAQKVQLGSIIEPDIAAEAKLRQIALAGTRPSTSGPNDPEVPEKQRTRDDVAAKVGLGSGSTYERGKAVLEQLANEPDGEQLMKHIEDGDWDIKDARKFHQLMGYVVQY